MAESPKPMVILPVDMSKPSLARDLITTATEAYKLYPKNCSGAVHWVIVNMVDPQMPPLVANDLMGYFASPANGWRQVLSIQEASDLANRGIVVVAGKATHGGYGHVIIVLPGPWKPAGGYLGIPKNGSYPPAMSTSIGTWAGAVSNGDKTIRDPWTETDWKSVSYWTHK